MCLAENTHGYVHDLGIKNQSRRHIRLEHEFGDGYERWMDNGSAMDFNKGWNTGEDEKQHVPRYIQRLIFRSGTCFITRKKGKIDQLG